MSSAGQRHCPRDFEVITEPHHPVLQIAVCFFWEELPDYSQHWEGQSGPQMQNTGLQRSGLTWRLTRVSTIPLMRTSEMQLDGCSWL